MRKLNSSLMFNRDIRILLITLFMLAFSGITGAQSVGIGTNTPDASAQLEVSSTNKGLLIPRMTTAQRTAISNVVKGLLVFDNTTSSFWFYNGTAWAELTGSGEAYWSMEGTGYLNTTTAGNVGIGVPMATQKLSVRGGIMLDEGNLNNGQLNSNALLFGNKRDVGISARKTTGGIGFNGLEFHTDSLVRMTIRDNGNLDIEGRTRFNMNVGIGTPAPTGQYDERLRVKGRVYVDSGSVHVTGGVTAEGWSMFGDRVTIGGGGQIVGTVLTAHGWSYFIGDVDVSNGELSVEGKGIVKSATSDQLKMSFASGTFGLNRAAGAYGDVTFALPELGTASNSRVMIAQFIPTVGSDNTWSQFTMTVYQVNFLANSCIVRFHNTGSATATINGTLYLTVVAPG